MKDLGHIAMVAKKAAMKTVPGFKFLGAVHEALAAGIMPSDESVEWNEFSTVYLANLPGVVQLDAEGMVI